MQQRLGAVAGDHRTALLDQRRAERFLNNVMTGLLWKFFVTTDLRGVRSVSVRKGRDTRPLGCAEKKSTLREAAAGPDQSCFGIRTCAISCQRARGWVRSVQYRALDIPRYDRQDQRRAPRRFAQQPHEPAGGISQAMK